MGALDVVVVWRQDGSMRSTDWHVVFDREKSARDVTVAINGVTADLGMQRGDAALDPAHFRRDTDDVSPGTHPSILCDCRDAQLKLLRVPVCRRALSHAGC